MSEQPLGPAWWQASDGTWHPPELHPSMSGDGPAPVVRPGPVVPPAAAVPSPHVPPSPATPEVRADDRPVATVEMPPPGGVPPRPVPSLDDVPNRPDAGGEIEQRTDVGPMFPDLFQQAVAGSRLADTITVHFADGEHRESLDVPESSGSLAGAHLLVSTAGTPPGEVGEFIGASAKKRRWRL